MNEVVEVLERIERKLGAGTSDGALSREAAAAFLSISVRELDVLATAGEIPRTKLGRRTVFQKKHLNAYLDKHTEMTKEEVERNVAGL